MNAQLLEAWSHDLTFAWLSALTRQTVFLLVAVLIRVFLRTSTAWCHWMWWLVAVATGIIPLGAMILPHMPLITAKWLFGEEAAFVINHVKS